MLGDGCLAYLTHVLVNDGDTAQERRSEFVAHAYGPAGCHLAEQLTAAVRFWDLRVRGHGYPQLTVYPVGTDLLELSEGLVLHKRHSRLVFDWDVETP